MPRFLELELEEQLRSLSSCRWCDFSSSCSLLSSSKRPQLLRPCPSLNPNVPIDSIAAVQPSSIFSVGGRPPELSTAASKTWEECKCEYQLHWTCWKLESIFVFLFWKLWNSETTVVSPSLPSQSQPVTYAEPSLRWTPISLCRDATHEACSASSWEPATAAAKNDHPSFSHTKFRWKGESTRTPMITTAMYPSCLYTKLGEIRNVGGWAW
jgi:hypothetical protein